MFIERELKLRQMEQTAKEQEEQGYKAKISEAQKQFESFLTTDIAPRYEYADLNALKAKAYSGGFRGLSDEAFKIAVENEAKQLHDKVITLAEAHKEKALEQLKKAKEKSVVVGKTLSSPVSKPKSFREAFFESYDENFK
jgi:hypothetical protein